MEVPAYLGAAALPFDQTSLDSDMQSISEIFQGKVITAGFGK
jgi:hypothetical protein